MNKKTKLAIGIGAPLILFTGCITGTAIGAGTDSDASASTPTETVTATPEPAPTVTETATPEPAPTVTETPEPEVITEEVEVAPDSCLTATDEGVNLTRIYSDALNIAADSIVAAASLDAGTIDMLTEELGVLQRNELEPALDNFFINAHLCNPDLAPY